MGEHVAHDVEAERREQLAEQVRESDRYAERAMDWASTHGWQHAEYVDLCKALFDGSSEFGMLLDDICDGEDTP
jgi:hypothetical protein